MKKMNSISSTGSITIMAVPGTTWIGVPAFASDIAVSSDGSVYHVGRGGRMYLWNGSDGWHDTGVDSHGVNRFSAGPDGDLWFFRFISGPGVGTTRDVLRRTRDGKLISYGVPDDVTSEDQ